MESISVRVDLIIKKDKLQYDTHKVIQAGCIYYEGLYENTVVWVKEYPKLKRDLEALSRAQVFLSEAKLLRDIQHECILSFYGVSLEYCCSVYEAGSLGPLSHFVSQLTSSFTVQQAEYLPCLYDVTQGMTYLHSQKKYAVHGNLKSTTVLLFKEKDTCRAKLSDLGFSLLRQREVYETEPKSYFKQVDMTAIQEDDKVSIAYVSPEFRSLSHGAPTKAGDVFAFGVMVLHVLTLLREDKAIAQGEEGLYRIQTTPALQPVLDLFISMTLKCLHKKPQHRPSFTQLQSWLMPFLKDTSVSPEQGHVISSPPLPSMDGLSSFSSQGDDSMSNPYKKMASIATTSTLSDVTQNRTRLQSIPSSLFQTSVLYQPKQSPHPHSVGCVDTASRRTRIIGSILIAVLLGVCVALLLVFVPRQTVSSIAPTPSATPTRSLPLQTQDYMWGGVNAYLLYAYPWDQQDEILNNLKQANVKIIRMYIKPIAANTRNIPLEQVPDLESTIGQYNDTILDRIDRLMFKASNLGMKLYIILHDRFELCIPSNFKNCSSDTDYVSTLFYNNTATLNQFDQRLAHVVTHKNPYFNNRPWGELSEAIYAFVIEEQSQAKLANHIYQETWMCNRAQRIKPYLKNVLLGTGGGENAQDSLRLSHFQCPYLDIVSLFDKDFTPSIVSQQLETAASLSEQYDKKVIFENFNMCAVDDQKAQKLEIIISRCNAFHIPWIVWGVLKPSASCEFYTTDTLTWAMLTNRAKEASSIRRDMEKGVNSNSTLVF